MKRFKHYFLLQLKWLTVLGMIGTIIIFSNNLIEANRHRIVDRTEFVKVVKQFQVHDFIFSGNKISMETPDGQIFTMVIGPGEFKDKVLQEIADLSGISGYEYMYIEYDGLNGLRGYVFIWAGIMMLQLFFLTIVFWLVTFFDLMKSEFTNGQNKWIWFISHLLLPFIAPVFYYFIAERQKVETTVE